MGLRNEPEKNPLEETTSWMLRFDLGQSNAFPISLAHIWSVPFFFQRFSLNHKEVSEQHENQQVQELPPFANTPPGKNDDILRVAIDRFPYKPKEGKTNIHFMQQIGVSFFFRGPPPPRAPPPPPKKRKKRSCSGSKATNTQPQPPSS